MTIAAVCSRAPVAISRTESVVEAARLMRKHHVGSLVVVEENAQGEKVPVGMLTDRDITISVTALALDPATITANEIMGESVVCANENAGIAETVELMRAKGVRRIPLVNDAGVLTGLLSADDLLGLLAEEMSGLAGAAMREHRHERQTRRSGV